VAYDVFMLSPATPTRRSLFDRTFAPALIALMVAVEVLWISFLVYLMALVV